ncbi:MAG: DUF2085 domain-containing protein [Lewinellaceae bacterium]|nr:DUF2085 domain-containing protein [Lewinellaceae bacterium]
MDKNVRLHFIYCHRKPGRSFFWKGRQFPVCARCTGIHLGYLSMPLFLFDWAQLGWWWSVALILPTYIDGAVQAVWGWESNNWRRLATGMMAGVGTMSVIAIVGKSIGRLILQLIN